MYKKNYIILLFIVFIKIIPAQNKEQCKEDAKEFIFVFSNSNSLQDTGGIEEITMKSQLNIQGIPNTTIEVNTKKYKIPSSGYLTIPDNYPTVLSGYSEKEIIKIKADLPVTVNAERISPYSSHNFPLSPVSRWGKEYILPGYQDQSPKYKTANFIDIIAQQNKTQVTIKNALGKNIKTISLKAGQNYEYNSTDDFTGYRVEANKNIGIISGNHCLRISAACDHIALMLPDITRLNRLFYNPGTSFFESTSIHRLVATQNKTQIKIDGILVHTLQKGEYYEYKNPAPHVIESSTPILGYSIFDKRSLSSPEYSVDPSTILIPSVDEAIQAVQFSFPEYMIYSKDIRITMKTDETDALLLDGLPVQLGWTPFSYDSSISCATLNISDTRLHTLSTARNSVYFIPVLMARGWDVSLGTNLKPGYTNLITGNNPPCPDVNIQPLEISGQGLVLPLKEITLTDIHQPIRVEKKVITVMVFDNAEEDGDIISLYLNDNLVYSHVEVLKSGTLLELELEKGDNILTIKAENEGRIYPNTAGLTFDDDLTRQTIILHNKKGQSKNLNIIYK